MFSYERRSVIWDPARGTCHFKYPRCPELLRDNTRCADYAGHPSRSHRRPEAVWAWRFAEGNGKVQDLYDGRFGQPPVHFTWEEYRKEEAPADDVPVPPVSLPATADPHERAEAMARLIRSWE